MIRFTIVQKLLNAAVACVFVLSTISHAAQANDGLSHACTNLKARILQGYSAPHVDPGSYRVVVRIKVDVHGKIEYLELVRSSGKAYMDKAALDAVDLAQPYPFRLMPDTWVPSKNDYEKPTEKFYEVEFQTNSEDTVVDLVPTQKFNRSGAAAHWTSSAASNTVPQPVPEAVRRQVEDAWRKCALFNFHAPEGTHYKKFRIQFSLADDGHVTGALTDGVNGGLTGGPEVSKSSGDTMRDLMALTAVLIGGPFKVPGASPAGRYEFELDPADTGVRIIQAPGTATSDSKVSAESPAEAAGAVVGKVVGIKKTTGPLLQIDGKDQFPANRGEFR